MVLGHSVLVVPKKQGQKRQDSSDLNTKDESLDGCIGENITQLSSYHSNEIMRWIVFIGAQRWETFSWEFLLKRNARNILQRMKHILEES